MLKNVMRTVMGGLLAASCLPAGSAWAQQAVMDEFYGNGVHNFYDRDFFQAMQNLSVAIDGGSKDPRAYYYRGLAKLRCGDTYGRKTICTKARPSKTPTSISSIPCRSRSSACRERNVVSWSAIVPWHVLRRAIGNCVAMPCDTSNAVVLKLKC